MTLRGIAVSAAIVGSAAGLTVARAAARARAEQLLAGGSIAIRNRNCGLLRIGDGHGVSLNRKPAPHHLLAMRLAFGWTWVSSTEGLTDE